MRTRLLAAFALATFLIGEAGATHIFFGEVHVEGLPAPSGGSATVSPEDIDVSVSVYEDDGTIFGASVEPTHLRLMFVSTSRQIIPCVIPIDPTAGQFIHHSFPSFDLPNGWTGQFVMDLGFFENDEFFPVAYYDYMFRDSSGQWQRTGAYSFNVTTVPGPLAALSFLAVLAARRRRK